APGVRPEVFWHALAAVSEETAQRRARDHVEEPSRERFRRALARIGCDARACGEGGAALARAHHRALGAAPVLPEAHGALLDALRGTYRLAVVSNFDDTGGAYDILHRHGILGRVDAVVISESLGLRKPHPLLVHTALRLLEVPPDAALLVGDTFTEDVAVAHAAGLARGRGPAALRAADVPRPRARAVGARYSRRGDGAPLTPRLSRLRSSGMALILSARSRSQERPRGRGGAGRVAMASDGVTRKSTGRSCGSIGMRSVVTWSEWTVVRIGVDSRTLPSSRSRPYSRSQEPPPLPDR